MILKRSRPSFSVLNGFFISSTSFPQYNSDNWWYYYTPFAFTRTFHTYRLWNPSIRILHAISYMLYIISSTWNTHTYTYIVLSTKMQSETLHYLVWFNDFMSEITSKVNLYHWYYLPVISWNTQKFYPKWINLSVLTEIFTHYDDTLIKNFLIPL